MDMYDNEQSEIDQNPNKATENQEIDSKNMAEDESQCINVVKSHNNQDCASCSKTEQQDTEITHSTSDMDNNYVTDNNNGDIGTDETVEIHDKQKTSSSTELNASFLLNKHSGVKLTRSEKRILRRLNRNPGMFSPMFKLVVFAFFGLILSLFVYGTLKMMGMLPVTKLPGFVYVNASRKRQVMGAMLKPGPRLVYCTNFMMDAEQYHNVMRAVKHVPEWINKIALDCRVKLPSGKTAYERFNFDESNVMFAQSHGKKAIGITLDMLIQPHYFKYKIIDECSYKFKHVYNPNEINDLFFDKKPKKHYLFITTNGNQLNMYNPRDMTLLSRIYDENKLYALIVHVIDDKIYELKFEDSFITKNNNINFFCVVNQGRGYYLAGNYKQDTLEDVTALTAFLKTCASVYKKNKEFRYLSKPPVLLQRPNPQDNE